MGTLFISLLTLVLLLISAFVVLIVLMQRTSQSGGMGAALGGGAAESAFGSDTNNILTKATVYSVIAFFLVALGLYLLYQAQAADSIEEVDMNTLISAQEATPATDSLPEALESIDLEGTSLPVAESMEGVADEVKAPVEEALETIDTELSVPQPAAN